VAAPGAWQGSGQPFEGGHQSGRIQAIGRIGSASPAEDGPQWPQLLADPQGYAHPSHEGGMGGFACERYLPSYRLHQDQGQGIDVGAAVKWLALSLFGRGVAGRAGHGSHGFGAACISQGSGDAKVGDAGTALLVEDQVGRFDVSMDKASPVGVVEGTGCLQPHGGGLDG